MRELVRDLAKNAASRPRPVNLVQPIFTLGNRAQTAKKVPFWEKISLWKKKSVIEIFLMRSERHQKKSIFLAGTLWNLVRKVQPPPNFFRIAEKIGTKEGLTA